MIYGRPPFLQARYALFILPALCAIVAAGCCFQSLPKTLTAPSPTPAATFVPPAPITPSIEKRVFDADVIVRARPPSVSGKVETVPSADECVAPTYRPALVFQFPVTEYLKGNGEDTLSVEFPFAGSSGAHTYLTQEEAQSALTKQLANRNETWDNRDAALFLKVDANRSDMNADGAVDTPPTYRFVRNTHNDYTIDKVNKPWLPVADASGQADGEPVYILDSEPEEGNEQLPTTSLAELRASIESVASILKAGEGIEGYEECVERWLIYKSLDDEPYRPRIRSTSPISENGYDIVSDENGVQEFFYFSVYATQRPLPRGAYRLVPHHYWAQWEPCNRNLPLDNWPRWEVAATAPNGASVAIEQIEWSTNTNKVALKLSNQSAKLSGHHIDFIELDASVSLRLDFDDAESTSTGYGQTLSWEVCRQPWHPGAQLMLRIAKSDATDSVTVKPICVDENAGEATPMPTITPTPTPAR